MKQEERLLKIEQVAVIIDSSVKTINNWYAFKKQNPKSKEAKLLPKFKQEGPRQTRYWKESDIPKLIQFKTCVKVGRNGFMGNVTQKYYHKKKEN